MLVPAVMAMRMPLLAAEAASSSLRAETADAFAEKVTALAEGAVAAQLAWVTSAMTLPLALMTARSPLAPLIDMAEDVASAALGPAGRQVRKNHRRLTRGR